MNIVTVKTIIKNIIDEILRFGFTCKEIGRRVDNLFLIDKECTILNYTPLKGELLSNTLILRRVIDSTNSTVTIFGAIRYGNSCIDLLEIFSISSEKSNIWLYDRLSENKHPYSKIQLRKDGISQNTKKEESILIEHMGKELMKIIER